MLLHMEARGVRSVESDECVKFIKKQVHLFGGIVGITSDGLCIINQEAYIVNA